MDSSSIHHQYAASGDAEPRQARHDNAYTETSLATHEAVRTPSKSRLRCSICIDEKIFHHADALRKHYRVLHPRQEIPDYPLLLADSGNVSRGSSRPYVCSSCKRRFRQHAHLERHRNLHATCLSNVEDHGLENYTQWKDSSPGQLSGKRCIQALNNSISTNLSSKDLYLCQTPLAFQVPQRRQVVEERVHPCMFGGCKDLSPFSSIGGLLRHERETHGRIGVTPNAINCPFPSCEWYGNPGFTREEYLEEHIRRYHWFGDSLEATQGEFVDSVSFDDMDNFGRPPSRSSMSSLGSVDSGISHPPTSSRKRRKIVSLSSSVVERWQRSETATQSETPESPSKISGY